MLSNSTIRGNFYSDEALIWINNLLSERFDVKDINVLRDKDFNFIIKHKEHESYIQFPKTPSSLWDLNEECPSSNVDLSEENLNLPFDSQLPLPGYDSVDKLFTIEDGNCKFKADLLGIIYWILCRVEELNSDSLDRHGRFQFDYSHAYKHNYLMRPIVDEYLVIIGKIMEKIWSKNVRLNGEFKISVSHDVDAPAKYPQNNYFLIFRTFLVNLIKGNLNECKLIYKILLSKNYLLSPYDAYNQFDWMMSRSEELGIKSTFYFICDKTSKIYDGDYKIRDEAIKNLIRSIYSRGHKLGVHFSYNSYNSVSALKREIKVFKDFLQDEKIQQEEIGSRMHYLRWIFPDTSRNLSVAGTSYDASVSYAGHPGFRAGTCFSYKAFDPIGCQEIDLEIRPLIAMENSILSKRYMNIGFDKNPEDIFYRLIDSCENVGGTFSLLWHNSDLQFTEDRDLYSKILNYASSKNNLQNEKN